MMKVQKSIQLALLLAGLFLVVFVSAAPVDEVNVQQGKSQAVVDKLPAPQLPELVAPKAVDVEKEQAAAPSASGNNVVLKLVKKDESSGNGTAAKADVGNAQGAAAAPPAQVSVPVPDKTAPVAEKKAENQLPQPVAAAAAEPPKDEKAGQVDKPAEPADAKKEEPSKPAAPAAAAANNGTTIPAVTPVASDSGNKTTSSVASSQGSTTTSTTASTTTVTPPVTVNDKKEEKQKPTTAAPKDVPKPDEQAPKVDDKEDKESEAGDAEPKPPLKDDSKEKTGEGDEYQFKPDEGQKQPPDLLDQEDTEQGKPDGPPVDAKKDEKPQSVLPSDEADKDPFADEDSGSGSFLTYFLVISTLLVGAYVAYHNRAKIMALVVEGRKSAASAGRTRRTNDSKVYQRLENVQDAMPNLH